MVQTASFRPLAGINCTITGRMALCRQVRVSVPLWGLYLLHKLPAVSAEVFAPLRGWYTLGERGEGAEGCFRPLTGIVPRSMTTERLIFRFRPLAGINCNKTMLNTVHMDAMFPSPDGAKSHAEKEVSNMTYEQVIVPLRGVVLLYHTLSQKKRTIHRRSADGVEMISHKDHLDSAEGASKP